MKLAFNPHLHSKMLQYQQQKEADEERVLTLQVG